MRIVALSDTHGKRPYIPPCDLVLIAGDIEYDSPGQLFRADDWLANIEADTVVIAPGNHDLELTSGWKPHLGTDFKVHNLLHGGVLTCGLMIEGFSWCYCPDFPELAECWVRMTTDESLIRKLVSRIPPCDILVSHSPPWGVLDSWGGLDIPRRNIGAPGLLEHAAKVGIKTIVCGHVHECGGQEETVQGVRVINVAERVKII